MPIKTHDGPVDGVEMSEDSTAKTPRKGRSAGAKKGAKTPHARSARTESQSQNEDEDDPPSPPRTVRRKTAHSRSRPVATTESQDENKPAKKTSKSRGKSKQVAETDDDENDSDTQPKPSRTRSKSRVPTDNGPAPPSRPTSRAQTRTESVEPSSKKRKSVNHLSSADGVPAATTGRKPSKSHSRTASKSHRAPPLDRDPNSEPQPSQGTAQDDVVEMDQYLPPPTAKKGSKKKQDASGPDGASPTPSTVLLPTEPLAEHPSKPDTTRKRTKPLSRSTSSRQVSRTIEKKSKVSSTDALVDSDVEVDPPPSLPKSKAKDLKSSTSSKPASSRARVASSSSRKPRRHPDESDGNEQNEVELKLVQISSDEEDEEPPVAKLKGQDEVEEKKDEEPADVVMELAAQEQVSEVDMSPIESDIPHTPPRRPVTPVTELPSLPPASYHSAAGNVEAGDTTAFPFFPLIAQEPFTNIDTLSEEELNMTVEQWIHHHIQIEHDRFRRDGERKLEEFAKRAEEVRVAIEAL